jgi:putative photosynthetic complex assembly protein
MSVVRFEGESLEKELIPTAAIKATGVLLVVVLVLAGLARYTGVGALDATSERTLVAERTLVFVTAGGMGLGTDGPLDLVDGETGEPLLHLAAGEGGFVRGAVRPLARERQRAGIDMAEPWHLVLWSDGALTLGDERLDMTVDLHAFGPTNAGDFAALLPSPSEALLAPTPGSTPRSSIRDQPDPAPPPMGADPR